MIQGIVASSKPRGGTEYIFDGTTDAWFKDESVTPDILDNVVNQSWVMRIKIDITGPDVSQGVIGTVNGYATSLLCEIDAGDRNKFDIGFRDTGESTYVNAPWGPDTDWMILGITYDTSVGIKLYKNGVHVGTGADTDFTGRTAGRILAIGASKIPSGTPKLLIGSMTDLQWYSSALGDTAMSDLNTDLTDTQSGLLLNFAEKKSPTKWTDNVEGFEMINQGRVTLI